MHGKKRLLQITAVEPFLDDGVARKTYFQRNTVLCNGRNHFEHIVLFFSWEFVDRNFFISFFQDKLCLFVLFAVFFVSILMLTFW